MNKKLTIENSLYIYDKQDRKYKIKYKKIGDEKLWKIYIKK
mgnify:CR=1 FL=1